MKACLGYKTRRDRDIFLLCWLAYSATYICRLNFSSVIPSLISGNVLSENLIASVSSAFFICYGLGQIVSGIIGDRLDTKYMVFCGVLLSSISNILIFFFHSYPLLLTLWAANGLFQSLVWSPILKLASLQYDEETKDKFGMQMSTTVPVGTVLSYAVSLLTMLFLPWKYVFLVCGIILAAVSFVWLFGTGKLHLNGKDTAKKESVKLGKSVKILICGGVPVLLIPIIVQGTLKDSVTQWVPEFFSSQFGSGVAFSLLLTMVLPIINVSGAFIAEKVNNKLHSEAKTSAVFFAASFIFLIFLFISAGKSLILSLISMVVVTNCMFAVNVMLITIVPLRFAKHGNVSTAAGILNATAYIGCAAMNQVAGELLQSRTWNSVIIFWLALSVIATLFCLFGGKTKRNKETR